MAKKMPRRAMSMSKRASKIAEAAADLDLVEGLIGDGNGEEGSKQKIAPTAYIGAWLAAVGTLIVIVLALRLVLALPMGSSGETADFSPDGAQTRSVATNVADAGVLPSAQRDAGDPRSPFPSSVTDTPIILRVTCPDGTVQIATGDMVADTVCVRGVLVPDILAATPMATPATPTATPTVTPMATPYVSALPTAGGKHG